MDAPRKRQPCCGCQGCQAAWSTIASMESSHGGKYSLANPENTVPCGPSDDFRDGIQTALEMRKELCPDANPRYRPLLLDQPEIHFSCGTEMNGIIPVNNMRSLRTPVISFHESYRLLDYFFGKLLIINMIW